MDKNFILKYGKFAGKSIAWLEENNEGYLNWAIINAPNLLKPPTPKELPKSETKDVKGVSIHKSAMVPNMNFWNEGPDEKCKPYLDMVNEKNKEIDDWGF